MPDYCRPDADEQPTPFTLRTRPTGWNLGPHSGPDDVASDIHHQHALVSRHAATPITMLIADRDIRIIATATGELLRHLELDPTRTYQPTGKPRNPRT